MRSQGHSGSGGAVTDAQEGGIRALHQLCLAAPLLPSPSTHTLRADSENSARLFPLWARRPGTPFHHRVQQPQSAPAALAPLARGWGVPSARSLTGSNAPPLCTRGATILLFWHRAHHRCDVFLRELAGVCGPLGDLESGSSGEDPWEALGAFPAEPGCALRASQALPHRLRNPPSPAPLHPHPPPRSDEQTDTCSNPLRAASGVCAWEPPRDGGSRGRERRVDAPLCT